jgi:hypothetical protein
MYKLLIFLNLLTFSTLSFASNVTDSLPRVFLLGEVNDNDFEKMEANYSVSLLDVNNGDMNQAYKQWVDLLSYIEKECNTNGLDIKGTKMWMNVYYNKDGRLDYLGYYLKANSRNIKTDELNAILKLVVKNYSSALAYTKKYSHNSNAAFPVNAN